MTRSILKIASLTVLIKKQHTKCFINARVKYQKNHFVKRKRFFLSTSLSSSANSFMHVYSAHQEEIEEILNKSSL